MRVAVAVVRVVVMWSNIRKDFDVSFRLLYICVLMHL
jgi:hypothetical protein